MSVVPTYFIYLKLQFIYRNANLKTQNFITFPQVKLLDFFSFIIMKVSEFWNHWDRGDKDRHTYTHTLLHYTRSAILFQFRRIKLDIYHLYYDMFQWEKLILICGCYENHCENRFWDSRRICSPVHTLWRWQETCAHTHVHPYIIFSKKNAVFP